MLAPFLRRHGSAVVVYDERSRQLSLRDTSRPQAVELTECPYCQRPLRAGSQEPDRRESGSSPGVDTTFVNPDYFRMLHHSNPASAHTSPPPSPLRRIARPDFSQGGNSPQPSVGDDGVNTPPRLPRRTSHSISTSAFSPKYFKTFFVEEGVLGKGSKGVVLLVRHMLDGVSLGQFACKRVPVGDDHEWLERVLGEVQLLQNLSHQNLVSYRHVWLEDYQITNFGPSVPCAFILQQYCNTGDLHHYILDGAETTVTTEQLKERLRRRSKGQAEPAVDLNGPRRMQFEEIYSFFKDITSGLHHLHANNYIHRDLKPSNCLLHTAGQKVRVLVSDFGETQTVNATRKSTGATGTISYCAPEVLRRETPEGLFGNFTPKSDIFSLGLILYFMCFARLPYSNADEIHEENEDLDQLREEIAAWTGFNDERRARPDLPEKLYKFLKRLLSVDPHSRPSTEEILRGIQAGSGIDEFTSLGSAAFENARSRISPIDTPSPASNPKLSARKQSGSPTATKPGQSRLRHEVPESSRKPSLSDPDETVILEENGIASTVVLRPVGRKNHSLPASPVAEPSRPLILPPPPTLASQITGALSMPSVVFVGKVILFLLKVLSVSGPCSPFAPNPWVAYPLYWLAALDFSTVVSGVWRPQLNSRISLVLLIIHVLAVASTVRSDRLCLRKVSIWDDM